MINKLSHEYTKAAEQGFADAQYNLGWCYSNGTGVLQDYKQAVYWYTKASEQGYANAQYNLGVCYYKGEGVRKDKIMAYACCLHAQLNGKEGINFDTFNLTSTKRRSATTR